MINVLTNMLTYKYGTVQSHKYFIA